MSTTDNAFSATLEPINTPKTTLKQRWWHIMDNWKVGIVPLPLFLLAGGADCPRLPWRQTAERYRGDGGHSGFLWLRLRRVW